MLHPNEVRVAKRKDELAIKTFLSEKPLIHRHLDWRHPLDWISTNQLLLSINQMGKIEGFFCCSQEIANIFWIRIFACKQKNHLFSLWNDFFNFYNSIPDKSGRKKILSLAYHPWMVNLLELEGWKMIDNIVQFELVNKTLNEMQSPQSNSYIRKMVKGDLTEAYQIDSERFDQTWQQTFNTFLLSYTQANYATVFVIDGRLVGFQLSTIEGQRAHLARIAVDKDYSGQGIGTALINDLIQYCQDRNIKKISVNTQETNSHSISLYRKTGFQKIVGSFPIYLLAETNI